MSSVKQIEANRANAQRSTGPRTDLGKVQSRKNAWKHGLTAREILVIGEDSSKFEALRAELWKQFQPAVGLESVLLDRLVGYAWRLRRLPVLEARNFANGLNFNFVNAGLLMSLSRYETGLLNASHRTLQELLVLQDRRRSEEEKGHTVDLLQSPNGHEAA